MAPARHQASPRAALAAAAALLALALVAATAPAPAAAQSCGCASGLCCSRFGFCGTGKDYCGTGCQSGPCDVPATNNVSVASIVTPAFFDALLAQADASCEATGFYTRDAFLAAAGYYPPFGRTGTEDDSKREIAAFFGNANHETIKFCYINEIDGPSKNYCDANNTQWPCQAGKGYYGRGPLMGGDRAPSGGGQGIGIRLGWLPECQLTGQQLASSQDRQRRAAAMRRGANGQRMGIPKFRILAPPLGPLQISWNFNYGPAGQSIGFDGLGDPDAVARSAVVAFRSALWYWMNHVHDPFVSGGGFGSTIRAINGRLECDGKNPNSVNSRVGYYKQFCQDFGVDPGSNLTC